MNTIIEKTTLDIKQTSSTTEIIINGREIFLNTDDDSNDVILQLLNELGFEMNVDR